MNHTRQEVSISLRSSNHSYAVLAFESKQAISEGYICNVIVATEALPINTSAVITFFEKGAIAQQFEGMIAQQAIKEMFGQIVSELQIVSRFALLTLQRQATLYSNQSVISVAKVVLKKMGYSEAQIVERLTAQYLPKEHIMQTTQETAGEFLQRILAEVGVFLFTDFDASRQQEQIIFADSNSAFLKRDNFYYSRSSGLQADNSVQQVYEIIPSVQRTAHAVMLQSRNEYQPQSVLNAQVSVATKTKNKISKTYVGKVNQDYQQLTHAAQIYSQAEQIGSSVLTVKSNVATLRVGETVDLNADGLDSSYSGQYLVVEVMHHLQQIKTSIQQSDSQGYYNSARLIPADQVYRATISSKPNLPLSFLGKISDGDCFANLDQLGKQTIIPDYIHAASSQPLPRLQPMTGVAEQSFGVNFPIADCAEILLGAINSDGDSLVILGSLPNAKQCSPVTEQNAQHNILRSYAENELNFIDSIQNSQITMQTFQGGNQLQLDYANKKINLLSTKGATNIQAFGVIHYLSGDSTRELHSENRKEMINSDQQLQVEQALQYQAKNEIELAGLNSVEQQAEGNVELCSDNNYLLNCQQQTNFAAQHGDVQFCIEQGHVSITAKNDLILSGKSGSEIHLSNGHNGLHIATNGSVDIYAQDLLLNASEAIALHGKVNYAAKAVNPNIPALSPNSVLQKITLNK